MTNQTSFTPEILDQLKDDHAEAVKAGLKDFMFGAVEMNTRYAGYLIEYLERKFGGKK